MLTIKLLREDPHFVAEWLAIRDIDARPVIQQIISLDTQRRAAQTEADALTAEQKKMASRIGKLMADGKLDEVAEIKKNAGESQEKVKALIADQAK